MSNSLMILGTGSDVGKSIVTTAFCRIFKKRGYKVTPFKAQNMSNNSYVTVEAGEIGRAQVVQAEAAGVIPSVHMNPILLKPSTEFGSQIVLHGKVFRNMEAVEYHDLKPKLRKAVMSSFQRLSKEYKLIVIEGAGSCCEMNLKKNDLVNLPMAKAANAPCILVADIDRGGVFAQIIGTYGLMTKKEKDLILGFLINKFRGDPSLFEEGIKYIEKKTGKPVVGLVPFYKHILIDSEDSVAVQEDKREIKAVDNKSINIAVLRLPAISNFTDLEILDQEKDTVVNYLFRPKELTDDYDCLILPGTKNVMEDMTWLARTGWKKTIRSFSKKGKGVIGICGGYQILGRFIKDPLKVESDRIEAKGLDLLPVTTTLEKEKIVRKMTGCCQMNSKRVRGYEIHMGKSQILDETGKSFLWLREHSGKKLFEDGCFVNKGQIFGTYLHGIFDTAQFRGAFLNRLRKKKGLGSRKPKQGRLSRFHQYDLLADHFEKYCDIEGILRAIESK